MSEKAVFLDRDGILNELVEYADTGEHESPRTVADLRMIDAAVEPLKLLQSRGYALFIISNQPSHAKGKTTLEDLKAVGLEVEKRLLAAGVKLTESFYCYHHPQGVVPALSGPCECRKPLPHFILKACEERFLVARKSWMLGDQDMDVDCGRRAGCRTALVRYAPSEAKRGNVKAEVETDSVAQAVEGILKYDAMER
ncbi:MAG: HAD-IIIA family hydrolase [Elusimicrobiota bacterium]|jgi:D-glycero-D-manno-heptose 1,7-bisphosphate phosphatase